MRVVAFGMGHKMPLQVMSWGNLFHSVGAVVYASEFENGTRNQWPTFTGWLIGQEEKGAVAKQLDLWAYSFRFDPRRACCIFPVNTTR